jgi:mannose-6-phosphate isomerase-like protein (cupin superfamily)
MSAAIETRRFDKPDQVLDMKARGRISIIKMADGTTGMHAIFESGWVWEVDEKPLLGNPPSCPMRHTGYCIAGRLVVRMAETNVKTNIGPGDFFEIPAGHDAYVEGNERVELVLFAPPEPAH